MTSYASLIVVHRRIESKLGSTKQLFFGQSCIHDLSVADETRTSALGNGATHRAELVFPRDNKRITVVSYLIVSVRSLRDRDPELAAIEVLERVAAEESTTLADCESYMLTPNEKVTPEMRARDERMKETPALPEARHSSRSDPYR